MGSLIKYFEQTVPIAAYNFLKELHENMIRKPVTAGYKIVVEPCKILSEQKFCPDPCKRDLRFTLSFLSR